jgi:hypothetical protein
MEQERGKETAEDRKQSKDLQEFIKEVVSRYDAMPLLSFVDVEMQENRRIFHMKKYSPAAPDSYVIARFVAKGSCKRCYGMGYRGLFLSNAKQFGRRPLLEMCSCLKELQEEEKQDGEERTRSSLPKSQGESGGSAT